MNPEKISPLSWYPVPNDYPMKGNQMGLSHVIERKLKEVRIRKEIRQVDQQRWANEEKSPANINNSILGIFILPSHGNIIESNAAAQQLVGYSAAELAAMYRSQLFEKSGTLLDNQFATPGNAGSVKAEFIGLRKDGSRFDCEVTVISFKDMHGELMKCSLVEDISERKKRYKKLKKTGNS